MTTATAQQTIAGEIESGEDRRAEAVADYIARLRHIVDISTLAKGGHGFDYAVTVTQSDKVRVMRLLADLTHDIVEKYGVKISARVLSAPAKVPDKRLAGTVERASARRKTVQKVVR